MAQQDLWLLSFKAQYHKLTGALPLINAGTDPGRDLAIVEHIGPGREYWLTYPFEKYDSDYWSTFMTLFGRTGSVRFNLSTALILSETLLGPEAFEIAIPDVWILAVEVLESKRERVI